MATLAATAPHTPDLLDVRLLGGVDVFVGDHRVSLGGAKPRALLALLALQPNAAVSVERLVDDVWGDTAPATVRASVQVHVSNLRRALATAGAPSLVETRGNGYAFVADPAVVDVHRFSAHARLAREAYAAGELDAARLSAGGARSLWRGSPLAGIGDVPFATTRTVALESDFLALVDLHADIEIALGRPADVVSELEWVVAAHPYREPTWARLAVALYRCGRQVDALARLHTLRTVLADDLGLEPSPDLAALEVAILNQDPSLRGARVVAERAAAAGELLHESRLPRVRPLLGRGALTRDLGDRLAVERLVTVVGPGGVGKTAVAVAAVAAMPQVSARFVDLAALVEAGDVLSTFLAAAGSRAADMAVGREALAGTLSSYRAPVLVVDNCEHVLDEVADLLVELMAACPALRVLATSRAPLGLPDEVIVSCPPLPAASALDLFVSRAQAADRDYTASDDERLAILDLVERLDGLPLAIELFAARAPTVSAVQMLRRFGDDELLSTAWRHAPVARHRSVHDVVQWSYGLLPPAQQRCLRRLSVFGGSFGLDAALAVGDIPDVHPLDSLVACSLVLAERTAIGVRYRMLDTVRAFAAAALDEDEHRLDPPRRLVEWVESWAARLAADVAGPDPAPAIDELELNAANVRVAYEMVSHDPAASAQLLAAFGPVALSLTLALPEAVTWSREVLAGGGVADRHRMILQVLAARLTNVGTDERKQRLRESIELAQRLGDRGVLAAAYAEYALAASTRVEESLDVAQRAMEIAAEVQQPVTLAWALNTAATSLVRLRRFDEATDLLDRHCLTGTRRFGVHEPHVLFQRGRLVMLRGDLDSAAEIFAAAEHATIRTRSPVGRSTAWYGLAEVERLRGRIAEAYAGYSRCLPADLILEPGETPLVRMMIVWTASLLGDLEVAEHHAEVLAQEEAAERAMADGDPGPEANATTAQGLLALAKGMDGIASRSLRLGIALWAEMDCWDVVADLIDRLPELGGNAIEADRLHELAAAVRDGTCSLAEAVEAVGAADAGADAGQR